MAQVINTNVPSLNAQNQLAKTNSALETSLQRLSSGLRINSAKDDAAGIAIAERFTAQIRGFNQGSRNAADAISMVQTAEGAINEIVSNVQRIRELAVQSANATNSSTDRAALQTEVSQLKAEIVRVTATQFNGIDVIGSSARAFKFQVGANNASTDKITVTTNDVVGLTGFDKLTAISAGLTTNTRASVNATGSLNGSVGTSAAAAAMIDVADDLLDALNTERANLGAVQNRFESVIRNADNMVENLSAARSRIQDADFAKETAELTKNQILQQAGISVLSQANSMPQSTLSLLG